MSSQVTYGPLTHACSLVFCYLIASGVRGLLRKLQLYVRRLSGMMVGVDSLAARAAGEASAVGQTGHTLHYWNRANFEGLTQLADALGEVPHLSLLASYCRHREQGLRREALAELDAFLNLAATWAPDIARYACQTILELHVRTPEVHQFLTQPLLTRFVLPVLDGWATESPACQTALRWLGLLRRDRACLERALNLTPDDVPVRRCLVDWILSDVEYAMHHLVESQFLGAIESTRQAIAEGRSVAEAAPDRTTVIDMLSEIDGYEALLRDWEEFSAEPHGTFPEWCAARGRACRWSTIVYYHK